MPPAAISKAAARALTLTALWGLPSSSAAQLFSPSGRCSDQFPKLGEACLLVMHAGPLRARTLLPQPRFGASRRSPRAWSSKTNNHRLSPRPSACSPRKSGGKRQRSPSGQRVAEDAASSILNPVTAPTGSKGSQCEVPCKGGVEQCGRSQNLLPQMNGRASWRGQSAPLRRSGMLPHDEKRAELPRIRGGFAIGPPNARGMEGSECQTGQN